ncbi:XRE family transcriptional regulator [Nitrincola iocasae]|uniref:XRE family transcriptional regulator n=1 Tax=Nitrincola iocasae TaxID=2614693 RepID=A0A5J6LBQ1_9GAMM|nr:XRE family transcriptional regulator [Nitrincola iocasae]QEW05632.1 XRE family transcriptional regulator [Nitrincola iocasae]
MSSARDRLEEEINKIGVTAISTGLGVARNTIYNWLAKANVPLNYLVALKGFGADVHYIVSGERSTTSLSSDEQELLELFKTAPLAVKAAVLGALTAGQDAKGGADISVTGVGNRVAGRDYREKE